MTPHRPAADLQARYQAFSDLAPTATSLTGSPEAMGLYPLVDSLIDEVKASCPPFACREGCMRCCVTTAPLVTAIEWQAIHGYLQEAAPALRQQVLGVAALLRPLQAPLEQAKEALLQGQSLPADFGFQCPFLVNGGCSIYPVRPLVCRTYGYMIRKQTLADGSSQMVPLLSDLAQMHIHATWPTSDWPLPLHNPYNEQLQHLNAAAGGGHAFLPQWLWSHEDGDGLRPVATIEGT